MPRQNGKNGALEIRELFGAVGLGEKILHTAHEVKTAQKHFRRLKHFFGSKKNDPKAKFPELNSLVDELRNVNGQEAIFLSNGGQIEIVARSKGSARGFTNDVIVCDEAQDMSDEDLEALGPATSAAPLGDPQKIYTGTPPGPKVNGEVFTRIRQSGLDGKDPRRTWHEWSAEHGTDLDDRSAWALVNPALITGRLLWSEVEDERGQFSDEGFGRERLGMWAAESGGGVIPMEFWNTNADELSVPVDRFALGIEAGPDLVRASVSLAGQRPDGRWHIELDENKDGSDWLIPYVERRVRNNPQIRAVVCDVGGPMAALVEKRGGRWYLKGSAVMVTALTVKELGAGCSLLLNGVVTGDVLHTRQGQLTAAAKVATKRNLADTGMWVFHRASSVADITPIQAAAYALVGAQSASGNVRRPDRSADNRRVVVL